MLAEVAEEGKARSIQGRLAIKEYMKVFKERKIKDIILGCTHYPIYDAIIREELGYDVNLINTGKSVANYIKYLLDKNNKQAKEEGIEQIFLSSKTEEFKKVAEDVFNVKTQILEK